MYIIDVSDKRNNRKKKHAYVIFQRAKEYKIFKYPPNILISTMNNSSKVPHETVHFPWQGFTKKKLFEKHILIESLILSFLVYFSHLGT